jgi:putative drug exporter of the RND superfamily
VYRYSFIAKGDINSSENRALARIFNEAIEQGAILPDNVHATLSGIIPYTQDEVTLYTKHTPLVVGSVLVVSFLALLIAFRSVVVPLKAILLNIISTTSAFGVLVLAFSGWGASYSQGDCIQSFVPPLLFTILFGLSMDYHVFLLARVKEEYDTCGDTATAVHRAANATFHNITSAAAIMIAVFLVIAGLEMPMMKQLGIGLATAVFIDATIVRCLLLPASMVLLGKWNWYCPQLLKRH